MSHFDEFSRQYVPGIDEAVSGFFSRQSGAAMGVQEVYPLLREFCLRPGKRIRPLLLLLGCMGHGTRITPEHLRVAAVIEIMHAFLLIHDDIVDRAETRRGGPSFHRMLDDRLGIGYGTGGAIVAGDMLAFDCLSYLCSEACAGAVTLPFLSLFAQCYARTSAGQCHDIIAESVSDPEDARAALRTAEFKTAYYTMIYPFSMGAHLAGVDAYTNIREALYPLGICFQLRDDIIGTFGEASEAGKPVLTDLEQSKNTMLIASGLEMMNSVDKRLFLDIFKKRKKNKDEIETLRRLLAGCNLEELLAKRMREFYNRYRNASVTLQLTGSAAAILDDIAARICAYPGKGRKNEDL